MLGIRPKVEPFFWGVVGNLKCRYLILDCFPLHVIVWITCWYCRVFGNAYLARCDPLWSTRWTFSQRWMLLTPVRCFYQLTNEARRRGWDSSKSISRKKMWERFLCWILCWEPKHPLHSCQRFGPRRGDRRWREKNSRSNFHSWQIAEWSHLFSLHLTSWTFFVW